MLYKIWQSFCHVASSSPSHLQSHPYEMLPTAQRFDHELGQAAIFLNYQLLFFYVYVEICDNFNARFYSYTCRRRRCKLFSTYMAIY